MNNKDIVVIADDIRSTHNVGSLLRTCEGIGVNMVYLCGYTPYPIFKDDTRLPHMAIKINNRIIKTSLGAENTISWEHNENIKETIGELRKRGYTIIAVELGQSATPLHSYVVPDKAAFIFGNERTGVPPEHLQLADQTIFIPMLGDKESFNVIQSMAMVLYAARYIN
jgi:23S rRNA (guanosine2251-2'-O)-methyltransferase